MKKHYKTIFSLLICALALTGCADQKANTKQNVYNKWTPDDIVNYQKIYQPNPTDYVGFPYDEDLFLTYKTTTTIKDENGKDKNIDKYSSNYSMIFRPQVDKLMLTLPYEQEDKEMTPEKVLDKYYQTCVADGTWIIDQVRNDAVKKDYYFVKYAEITSSTEAKRVTKQIVMNVYLNTDNSLRVVGWLENCYEFKTWPKNKLVQFFETKDPKDLAFPQIDGTYTLKGLEGKRNSIKFFELEVATQDANLYQNYLNKLDELGYQIEPYHIYEEDKINYYLNNIYVRKITGDKHNILEVRQSYDIIIDNAPTNNGWKMRFQFEQTIRKIKGQIE